MDPNARGGVRRYLDIVKPEEYVPNIGEVDLTELSLTGLADLYGSDKGTIKHNYTVHYERLVNDVLAGRDRKKANLTIGEAGVACGASLRMWGNYLPASFVYGYDIRPECETLCQDMKTVTIVTFSKKINAIRKNGFNGINKKEEKNIDCKCATTTENHGV